MNTTDNNAYALVGGCTPDAVPTGELVPVAVDQLPTSGRRKRTKAADDNADVAAAKPTREKSESKVDAVLKRLRTARGVSVPQITQATGWQAHSVRGFLSGTVRKKLGLTLVSEVGKDGVRRYRIDSSGIAGGNGNASSGSEEASA